MIMCNYGFRVVPVYFGLVWRSMRAKQPGLLGVMLFRHGICGCVRESCCARFLFDPVFLLLFLICE